MIKTKLRTGRMPNHRFRNNPELQRAMRVRNRLENGIINGWQNLSYEEMVMVEHLNSWISEARDEFNPENMNTGV